MRRGRRRVWCGALLLMLFAPTSIWKSGSAPAQVRVTVHEPDGSVEAPEPIGEVSQAISIANELESKNARAQSD